MQCVKCELLYHSLSPHLQQIYTGFFLLRQRGLVSLHQKLNPKEIRYDSVAPHLKDAGKAHLSAFINENVRIHYDTHDSVEIPTSELNVCDFYFKRSYSQSYVQNLSVDQRKKVVPLGLNYFVLPNSFDQYALKRRQSLSDNYRSKIAELIRGMDVYDLTGFRPRLRVMEAAPNFDAPPQVMFLVAAYDPYDDENRSEEKIEERNHINETRARCIQLLKKELGPKFCGGFKSTRFTLKHYPDLVVPISWTSHKNYLQKLRTHSICVATTGLHGSIGWKLAEYVAFSKAIVAEKLLYKVPGNFERDENYLEFTTPEECVSAALKLVANDDLRALLAKNNASYYQQYVRPDALVLNSLRIAIKALDGVA